MAPRAGYLERVGRGGRPGRGGVVVYRKKPTGRTVGVPATTAEQAASRIAALKHGGRASAMSIRDARGFAVEKRFGRGAREVLDRYHAAIAGGDECSIQALAIRGLTDLEMIRRSLVSHVASHGAVLTESIFSPSTGEVIGERIKLHPGVDGVSKVSELLGHTSAARRLDPKSRGEGQRDEALAKMLARDAFLRAYAGKNQMAPPPADDDIVEADIVPRAALADGGED